MRKLALLLLLICASVWAQEPPRRTKKRWLLSVAALIAAGAADTHSSYGGYEANPLLRSADGRLRARGVAIKFGLLGGAIATEYLIIRKHPETGDTAFVANLAATSALTAVAVRNYRFRGAEALRPSGGAR
mgnify:CR=1 FL=1